MCSHVVLDHKDIVSAVVHRFNTPLLDDFIPCYGDKVIVSICACICVTFLSAYSSKTIEENYFKLH